MKKSRTHKDFIYRPQYPGGKKAFIEFIKKNLKYPELAIEKKVEGKVYLRFHVDFYGKVNEVKVLKGIGCGCDDEAVRLVSMLEFAPQRASSNKSMKVASTMKTSIQFKLKEAKVKLGKKSVSSVKYSIVMKEKTKPESAKRNTYGYTIKFN